MQVNYNFDPLSPRTFQYYFTDIDSVTTSNLHEAMQKAAMYTKEKMSKLGISKVAICLSGLDGELIVHYLTQIGIPVEGYTLDIDNAEPEMLAKTSEVCQKYNIPHHIIHKNLNEIFASGELLEYNDKCHARHYPYITHPILIKEIPNDYYIIMGNGGLERTDGKYDRLMIGYLSKEFDLDNYMYVPIDGYSQVVTELALKAYNKHGDTLWYSSCWDIWYHILRSEFLDTNGFSYYDESKVKLEAFKHINNVFHKRTIVRRTVGGAKNLYKIQHYLHKNLFDPESPNKTEKPSAGPNGCYIPIHKDLLK